MDAIENGASIAPNFYDGLKVVEVLAAGTQSAETGVRVEL
jgi:predicted dehydrogenase